MKNKEVLDKLQYYYLTQCDPQVVARALASAMIDYHRLTDLENLPEKELKCLEQRIVLNATELESFIEHGPTGTLKIHAINSDEN